MDDITDMLGSQKRVDTSFLMSHLMPLLHMSLAFVRLLQTKDLLFAMLAVDGYFFLSVLAQTSVELLRMSQTLFTRRALLRQ